MFFFYFRCQEITRDLKYRLEDLQKAMEDLKNRTLSLGKAAITYSVPKTTIFDYLKKIFVKQPKCRRKCILSAAQEKELEEHIVKCSKRFYGLRIEMVRKIAS